MSGARSHEDPKAGELAKEVAKLDPAQFNFFLLRLSENVAGKRERSTDRFEKEHLHLTHSFLSDLIRELDPDLLFREGQR